MKLRYHQERSKRGLLILEAEPQVRSLFSGGNKFTERVALPYMQFLIRYYRRNGDYCYEGLSGNALKVFCSNEPLKSFRSVLFQIPTDDLSEGIVCTDHRYDFKHFDSLANLATTVVGLWYGHTHYLCGEWVKTPFSRVLETSWQKYNSLKKVVSGQDSIPFLARLVDKPWPPK